MKSFLLQTLFIIGLAVPFLSATGAEARVAHFSTQAVIGSGSETMVAGFVVTGSGTKEVLVRALGPALTVTSTRAPLANPLLQVYDARNKLVGSSEKWSSKLSTAFKEVGASALKSGSADAALRLKLKAGAYTVHVSGVNKTKGLGKIEIFEIGTGARLTSIRTRAAVNTGSGVMVSTVKVGPGSSRRILIRAAGPALAKDKIAGALANPALKVVDSKGKTIATNGNWETAKNLSELKAAVKSAGATAFAKGSKDAAILTDLPTGTYNITLYGASSTKGIGMVEVFDVTPAAAPKPPAPKPPVTPLYSPALLSWTSSDVSKRLGPTFAELNQSATDDRPTHYTPSSKLAPGYWVRITPYEIGDGPSSDYDYWSDSGQVAYVPDDLVNDPGLDRIQTFAHYNHVWAISPRLDGSTKTPHPDPQTREANYYTLNGAKMPMQPVAMVRSAALQTNEALVIYKDGLFACAGMQTSRAAADRPYPGFKFPAHKVPRAIAITTSNEFALVTIWDTEAQKGQLAVVALEGKFLKFHTWPHMGFPNQGSWSDFKLLGYVDLPMQKPNAIAAASNGLWLGPSATAGKVFSQIDLALASARKNLYDGAWKATVATNGYAIVSSTEENKAVILDLSPLFSYMRESYLSSEASFNETIATRGPGEKQFPQTFSVRPAIVPKVIWSTTLTAPTAVLAGQKIDRWSVDHFKAYIATRDGTIHILDTSSLLKRYEWERLGELRIVGTVKVGRNPVSMVLARHGETGLPLIPIDYKTGLQRKTDGLNNMIHVACRGDREVVSVVTWNGTGQVYRRFRDKRLSDPVHVAVAWRGNIMLVADYAGKKIVSFRIGALKDLRNGKVYPAGPAGANDPFEFGGELKVPGSPFMVSSANLN